VQMEDKLFAWTPGKVKYCVVSFIQH